MPDISIDVEGKLVNPDGGLWRIPTGISYTTDNPYALHFVFYVSDEKTVSWVLSIELFEEAYSHFDAPVGDYVFVKFVRSVNASDQEVWIHLPGSKGGNSATVRIPAQELGELMEEVHELMTDDAKEEALNCLVEAFEAYLREQRQ